MVNLRLEDVRCRRVRIARLSAYPHLQEQAHRLVRPLLRIVSSSGQLGGQVFLNVAVYFEVTVTTIVCIASLPSDQDLNS